MGVNCEGYGLRLNWILYDPHDRAEDNDDAQIPGSRVSRRSLVSHVAFPPLSYLPSSILDATLVAIDEWYPGDASGMEDGAFGVFPVHPTLTNRPETIQSQLQIPPQPSQTTASAVESDDDYTVSVDETTGFQGDDIHKTEDQFTEDAVELSTSTVQSFPALERYRPSPSRHLDVLAMPSKQKRLIHHWITFTSRKLVLIDEPHNPCRTMMLPMALKGLVSGSGDSSADVAVFHAICAAAAFNLFELTGQTNEQDRVLALYHDDEAVHYLRHNLARADEHRDQSFAMAIMACIAVEAVSGTTQRWRTHVSGGLAYLTKLQSQGLDEAALSAFRQHMVKMAILCDFDVPDNLKSFLYDESGSSDGLEFTFPYYGVSRSFLRAHDQVNSLLLNALRVRTPAQEQELDAFELQLYLDFPGLPPHNLLSAAANKIHGIVVQHTSRAFYYANLVFFQRSVRCVPVIAVQDLVELGVQELESIDRVGQGSLGCLMLWPVLILGAECDTTDVQKRMRDWFQAQRKLGFRNLRVLEDLVATVWKARTNHGAKEDNADWRQVIAQARFDVFRL